MNKKIIMLSMSLGLYGGSYIPMLWGVGGFSFQSVLFGGLGGIMGIYIGYRLTA